MATGYWKRELGSRRRIARIRWKGWEIAHAIVFILLMTAFCLWLSVWVAGHHFD